VWIFYSACILLLSTEFACVVQNRFGPVEEISRERENPPDR